MPTIANIRVGKAQVDPAVDAHVDGIREGNEPGGMQKEPGHVSGGKWNARRSTGINPSARNPIDQRMPTLTPA